MSTLARPHPQQPGHPLNHGFVKCSWCGTAIPETTAEQLAHEWACRDRMWCARQILAAVAP